MRKGGGKKWGEIAAASTINLRRTAKKHKE